MNTLMMDKWQKGSKGFTLIELMIAIAIVGVLAAIAVPAFSNYLARARVSEAINYAQSCKTGYLEYYATSGVLPANNDEANCPTITTDNVANVTITSGTGAAAAPAIRVLLVNAAPLPSDVRNHVIVIQPLDPNNGIVANGERIENWRCSLTTTAGAAAAANVREFVPAICRNSVATS
ncbi:pilin [Limnobacter parvus]|uniref:pilin n=1 Tax=Limnobacter parvus TaxID=2939690 RepID=UPI0027D45F63|nr:prepilin-type N-terminal cleavage/methylation domain-containing protein [Limnobacter parvus]